MMKCWSFNPEERPTFRYCLDVLDDILSHTDDVALQGTFISKLRFLSSTASKKKSNTAEQYNHRSYYPISLLKL